LELQNDQNRNEVKEYLDSPYIRIGGKLLAYIGISCMQNTQVQRLPVHLEGRHLVYFMPMTILMCVERGANQETPLTAWFKINETNPD